MKTLSISKGFHVPTPEGYLEITEKHPGGCYDAVAWLVDDDGNETRKDGNNIVLTRSDILNYMRDSGRYFDLVDFDEDQPRQISLDNGRTYLDAAEAIEKLKADAEEYETPFEKLWQNVADLMDDDLREQVHAELAPCTEEEFLERYLELSDEDLIVG